MKAIILAAGFGGRMRPLTDNKHKTLLEISGETIVDRMLNALKEVGVKDVIVATGYRHTELVAHLEGTHADISFTFVNNERFAETNNIFSLALVLESVDIDDDIILIESDLIFKSKTLKKLADSKHHNVAMVDRYRSGMDGTVVRLEQDIVVEVIPPHLQGRNFDFSDKYKTLNIYKFSREFLNGNFSKIIRYYAQTIDDNCYYELILGLLIYLQQDGIHAELVDDEGWAEVDDPNDLSTAEFAFDKESRLGILDNAYGGMWNYDVLDFCYIRNMHFPTSAMLSELKLNLEKLLQNYGSSQKVLNTKLSYALLCDAEKLCILNGASQIFPILARLFHSKRILMPSPSFGEYERVFPDANLYKDAVGFDPEELQLKSSDSDLVVIVNPNNPTGSTLKTEFIFNLAKSHPSTTYIIDESFIDFSDEESIITELEKEPLDNVLVMQSLSKSWGVPGVRLGFIYTSNKTLLADIGSEVPIWNSNSVAEFYLEIFLKHKKSYSESIEKTKADRSHLKSSLEKLSVVESVFDSQADFLLLRLKGDSNFASKLTSKLIEKYDIYVKNISSKINDGRGYLRIAVRLPLEHEHLANAISSVTDDNVTI